MGKIKKLQDKGATILPLTVADAVLMNSAEAGNLSTYLEALKSGVDFLLSIIGEDQAGDIFLKTKDGMPRGFYTDGFVSAGGKSASEGGGGTGGGGGGLSLTDMWASLNGNIDAYGKSKIHIDHIPLDVILSHDDYENDVADRINTFNYNNSSSFTSAVKALIVADNIPTLEMSKIEGLETTLTNIGTVVQNNYDNLNESISTLQNGTIADHEARIKAIEQALTWQTV